VLELDLSQRFVSRNSARWQAAMVFAMAYPEPPSAKERGQQGQPYEPDAVFFSVVCGFTHADSSRA
jgi:hypothetical protein